jgi:threonine/homoserine/homoserine lactone efflux protein
MSRAVDTASMSASNLLAFALASLVMVALPGPDQVLITRNALAGGATVARRTMLGGACGLGVHATGAALGISALLATSATAFTALKLVGAAYLVFLALRMLSRRPAAEASRRKARVGPRHPFAQGLFSNALNPKVALFFVTFLPQFLATRHAALPAAFALAGTFALIYLTWFSALIEIVERVGRAFESARVQRRLERVTAGALLAFAVRLATTARP